MALFLTFRQSRPAKRARSGSFRSTPPDQKPITNKDAHRKVSPLKTNHVDPRVKPGVPKPNGLLVNGAAALPSSTQKQSSFVNRSSDKRSYLAGSSSRPTNGLTTLPVRPSPGRQTLPPKKAVIPEVIDLDTDSEGDIVDKSQHRPLNRPKSRSLTPATADLKLSDWIKPEVKPIRFDATTQATQLSTTWNQPRLDRNLATRTNLFHNLPQIKRSAGSPPSSSQPSSKSIQLPKPPTVLIPASEAQVLRKIKEDISYIRVNPQEVETRVGVARFVDTDLNEDIFQKAKQKRQKTSVNRASIKLDLRKAEPVEDVHDSTIIEPRFAIRHVLQERFKHHQPPLTFANRQNERQLSGKFQFVNKYVWSKGVLKKKQQALPKRACQCLPSTACRGSCMCAIVQAKDPGEPLKDVLGVRPYERNSLGLNVLSRGLLDLSSKQTPIIYECTPSCSCGDTCASKVVQKGRTLSLQIFMTEHCGFGVRAMQNISRGQFIDIYLGELLTDKELGKRESAAEEDTPSYAMSLDMFITDEKAAFQVDGANFGSLTRFVNHSCEPNTKTIPVVLADDTKHIYHVAFFAIKDIAKGNEITIDYNPDLKDQVSEETLDSEIVQCKCKTPSCRKRLWMPGKAKRNRRRYLADSDND